MSSCNRIIWLALLSLLLGACQGLTVSPEQQTATTEAEAVAQHIATLGSMAATGTAEYAPTAAAPTEITPSATPTITPTPDPFPTQVKAKIYVAEQRFEHGWMFWLQPNSQIWVLTVDDAGNNIWTVYDDTFVEGQAEYDPQLIPPEGRQQPIRGFGKLWRENLEVRQQIGWALELERGHTSRYVYKQGGHINDDSEYIPGPGYHQVRATNGDDFRFYEETFTWSIDS